MKKLIFTAVIIVAQLFAVAQVQKVENSRFSDEKASTRQYGFITIVNESGAYDFTISALTFQETGSLVKSRNWAVLRKGSEYSFTQENSSLKAAVSLVNFTQITRAYEDVYYENGVEINTGEVIEEKVKGKTYHGMHLAFKVTFPDGRTQIVSGEIQINQSIESGKEVGHSYSFVITDELLGIRKHTISLKNSSSFGVMLKSPSGAIVLSPSEERTEQVNHRDVPQNGMYTFDLWIKSDGFAWAQIDGREKIRLTIVDGKVDITTSDIVGKFVTTPNPVTSVNDEKTKDFNSLNIIKNRKNTTVWVENGTGKMLTMYIPRAMEGSVSDLSELQPYILDLSRRPLGLSAVPGQYPVLYYVGEFSGKFRLGTIGITNNKQQKVVVGTRSIFSY